VESREAPAPAVLRAWPAPPSEAAEAHTQAVASLPPPPVPGAAPPVPAARPPRRPGRLAAAGLVALALIGGVVAWRAVADDGTGSTTTPATAPSTSAPPRSTTTLGDTQIPPDATPGAITSLWRIALPYQGSGTFSGLAADEARVYVAWDEPDLVAALEVGTGATLWEAPLDVDTRFVHAADGNVYVQAYREDDEQGFVVALVADSGVERWRTEHHTGTDGTTPAVAAPGAGLVYVSNVDSIEALDAGTGEVVWSEDVLTQEPAASGDTLVVNFLAELRVLDAATGENRWAVERASDAIGQTPVIVEAAVVTVDDDPATAVVAYDRQSGDELWTEDLGQEIEELVAVGSSVLALTTLDRLFVLDERGDRVFTAPVAPVGQTAWDLIPAAARVFAVAEDDHIVAYNDQGVRLQTIDAQALVTGDPNGGFVGLISAASAVGDGLVFHVGGHADGVIVVRLG
ncbi:MAG: PQQ-binding-like beta-propeller repeat protein, partial [Acidimicrobiales bacterium]